MATHEKSEIGWADGIDRAWPGAGKAVRKIGQEAVDRVPGGHRPLLRTKDENVASGMGMAMKIDVQIEGRIPEQVRFVERDGRQLQRVVLQLGLVGLHLRDLVRAPGLFRSRGGVCCPSPQRVDLLRDCSHRSLYPGNFQVRNKLFGGCAGDEVNLLAGQAIRMITLGVVPMKMRVDNVTN